MIYFKQEYGKRDPVRLMDTRSNIKASRQVHLINLFLGTHQIMERESNRRQIESDINESIIYEIEEGISVSDQESRRERHRRMDM
jgi:hypothetical protein